MQTGENIYDGYVNDCDLIGTHWRYQQVRSLTDWMADEGKDVTNPNLDLRTSSAPPSLPAAGIEAGAHAGRRRSRVRSW